MLEDLYEFEASPVYTVNQDQTKQNNNTNKNKSKIL